MGYRIQIRPSALKEIRRLPDREITRIETRIDDLAREPRPHGTEKMQGGGREYRLRVGNYRVIYSVDDEARLVMIEKVGHRGDVYRKR